MSYPIILCVMAVEALNLALLGTALRARIPRGARVLVACSSVSGAWGAWVLVIVLHGPVWIMGLTGLVFALGGVALGIAIHRVTCEKEDRHDGGEGWKPSPGPSPQDPGGGGDDEPLWWPEFEQQVAAYAAQHERQRQPVDC